jgi:hypothetical protein
MPNLTLSVPHNLSRAEVKRRIQEHIALVQQQYGQVIGTVEQRWIGDRLDFAVVALRQRIAGWLAIEDTVVRVEIELPWMLGLLAGAVRQQLEHQGRQLLGQRA